MEENDNLKNRILDKARELFMDYGIKNVTMDMLSSELSVSKRTLYEIFTDKENLVVETLMRLFEIQNDQNRKIIAKSPNSIYAIFEIFKNNHKTDELVPKIFKEDMKKYFHIVTQKIYADDDFMKEHSCMYKIIEDGIEQGLFRKEISPEVVNLFLHELFGFVMQNERIRLKAKTNLMISQNIMMPYFRGICTAKGLEMMNESLDDIRSLIKG